MSDSLNTVAGVQIIPPDTRKVFSTTWIKGAKVPLSR